MTSRQFVLTTMTWMCAGTFGATAAVSAQTAEEHQQHHPAAAVQAPAPAQPAASPLTAKKPGDMAEDDKLNALMAKMNAATGAAKVDAMADVLTALVTKQQAMKCGMMEEMTSKMKKMKGQENPSDSNRP